MLIVDIWKSITSDTITFDTISVWKFIAVSILTSIICFVLLKTLMFI